MRKRAFQILKYAGGFIGWVIGSGFATGQEILQFFASYGWKSYLISLVNLIGFLVIGILMMYAGFEHREKTFNHYEYYCGKTIGKVYAWVIPVTLVLLLSVLTSAAGATCSQYFGWNRFLCSGIMSMLVLAVYLIGFEKMVRIVSLISPLMIAFSVFVALFTVFRDVDAFYGFAERAQVLADSQAAPHWSISALLYLSLNFLCGSTYYTALGQSAERRREARWGAVLGSVVVVLTITATSTAILLNANEQEILSVPTLCLAKKISPLFGGVFSVVLLLGTFSACSTTMWSFCSRYFAAEPKKNRAFALGTAIVTYLMGLFSFSGLVATVYPLIGYAGLFFIGCVIVKGFCKNRKPD